MRIRQWVVAAAMLSAAGKAMALACPGPSAFGDVAQAEIFCTDVSWLANRGVTLGCSGGNYCPDQNVTRAQMALFMQRLGTVLSPRASTHIGLNQNLAPLPTTPNPGSAGQVVCRSNEIVAPAAYPRIAVLSGWFSFRVLTSGARMRLYPAVSLNDGAWTRYGPEVFNDVDMAVNAKQSIPIVAQVPLPAGQSLRVGVYPLRLDGAATGLGGGECLFNLLVFSQTGTGAPYDAGHEVIERALD